MHSIPRSARVVFAGFGVLVLTACAVEEAPSVRTIQEGSRVTLSYKLSLDSGEVVFDNTQEDPFVFTHGDGRIFDPGQLSGQRGHLVVMGGEQGAAAVGLMQMFQRRPGDGQAIIGRGAAPDFIQNHQRAIIGLV